MMTEYVTLEQAAVAFATQSVFSTSDCLDALHYAIQKGWITPSDVAPVRHGQWIYNVESGEYVCSACGENALSFKKDTLYGLDLYETCLTDYCPNCGARMDEEAR